MFVVWDLENLPPVRGQAAVEVVADLEACALAALALPAEPPPPIRIRAFVDVERLAPSMRRALSHCGVVLQDNGLAKSEQADRNIERFLLEVLDDFAAPEPLGRSSTRSDASRQSPIALVALVSSDLGFAPILSRLESAGIRCALILGTADAAALRQPLTTPIALSDSRHVRRLVARATASTALTSAGPGAIDTALEPAWPLTRACSGVALAASLVSFQRIKSALPVSTMTPTMTPTTVAALATPQRAHAERPAPDSAAAAAAAAVEAEAEAQPRHEPPSPDPAGQEEDDEDDRLTPLRSDKQLLRARGKLCAACGQRKMFDDFSMNQWRRGPERRCRACVGASVPPTT